MTWFPDRKVLAGGVAGLVAWGVTVALSRQGIVLPPEVQTAMVGMVGWAIAYLVPPSTRDIIKRLNDGLVVMAAEDPKIPVSPAVADALKRTAPILVACVLGLGLTACAKTEVTKDQLTAAIEAGQDLTPEQKWEIACQSMDAAHLVFVAFVAPKQPADIIAKEAATYEGIKAICAAKPMNTATAIVALLSAVNAYKASFAASKITKA